MAGSADRRALPRRTAGRRGGDFARGHRWFLLLCVLTALTALLGFPPLQTQPLDTQALFDLGGATGAAAHWQFRPEAARHDAALEPVVLADLGHEWRVARRLIPIPEAGLGPDRLLRLRASYRPLDTPSQALRPQEARDPGLSLTWRPASALPPWEGWQDGLSVRRNTTHRVDVDQLTRVAPQMTVLRLQFSVALPGRWALEYARIDQVRFQPAYRVARLLLIGAWSLLLIALPLRVLRRRQWRRLLLAVMLMGLSLLSLLLPTEPLVNVLARLPMPITIDDPWQFWFQVHQTLYQGAHFVLFLLVTTLLLLWRKALGHGFVLSLMIAVVLALASEAMQMHSFAREAGLGDLIQDLAGIAVAALGYGVMAGLRQWGRRLR